MAVLPITRVVLYKHGIGHFEREGTVDGDATLALTFTQAEVSDVLKSLTVLDEGGGHIASVSYDSTKPLEQLLAEVALSIPDDNSVVGLLPQIKGVQVRLHTGVDDPIEGSLIGVDTTERHTGDGVVREAPEVIVGGRTRRLVWSAAFGADIAGSSGGRLGATMRVLTLGFWIAVPCPR